MIAVSAAVFVGVIAGVVAATLVFANKASATIDPCSTTYHYWNEVDTVDAHHGIQVTNPGMSEISEPPVGCEHISSILSEDSNGNWIEAGWVDTVKGVDAGNCHNTGTGKQTIGDGNDQVFRERSITGGATWTCTAFGDLVFNQAGYDEFQLVDRNGDMTWDVQMDGSNLGGTENMPFSLSYPYFNGERYGPNDSEDALFDGLQYMPLNGSWTDWGSPGTCRHNSSDPYDSFMVGAFNVWQVKKGSGSC